MEVQKDSRTYYTNYVRNSRAVGLMWAIFVICLAIICIVVFIQPQWIGDTSHSIGTGYFGLYRYCEITASGRDHYCQGEFFKWDDILSGWFQAAAICVGVAVIISLLTILCLLLFIFIKTSVAYIICGCLLVIVAVCLFLGCVLYPAGWGHEKVANVCGNSASKFNVGDCAIRWAYILAIIAIFDALVLAVLAFVLAARQAKWSHVYGSPTKSEMGDLIIETASKPSIAIHPVGLTLPDPNNDRYSEFSHASTKRSRKGDFAL